MGLEIPVWGQYSLAAGLLGIVIWVVIAVLNGNLVTAKRQAQIDAQHVADVDKYKADLEASEARSARWQQAYEKSQELDASKTETISRLAGLAEVFEAFIHALPRNEADNDSGK